MRNSAMSLIIREMKMERAMRCLLTLLDQLLLDTNKCCWRYYAYSVNGKIKTSITENIMIHSQKLNVEVPDNLAIPLLCIDLKILNQYVEEMSNTNHKS